MSTSDAEPKPTGSEPNSTPATAETTETQKADAEGSLLDGDEGTPKPEAEAEGGESLLGDPEPKPDSPPAFGTDEVTLDTLRESLPEGSELDEDLASSFLELVNSAESRADLATKLTSFYNEAENSTTQAIVDEWNTVQKDWKDAVRKDPDIGGDALNENLAKARTVVETYAKDPSALKEVLKITGAGNNIEVVRFLTAVADALPGEAKPVEGTPGATSKALADRLFGGSTAS